MREWVNEWVNERVSEWVNKRVSGVSVCECVFDCLGEGVCVCLSEWCV